MFLKLVQHFLQSTFIFDVDNFKLWWTHKVLIYLSLGILESFIEGSTVLKVKSNCSILEIRIIPSIPWLLHWVLCALQAGIESHLPIEKVLLTLTQGTKVTYVSITS